MIQSRLRTISVILLLLASIKLNGQIIEQAARNYFPSKTHTLRTISAELDTISIPIWDDFSTKNLNSPDTSIWAHSQNVFVGNGHAYLPPSLNVAILDGFNSMGLAYDNDTNSYGVGDSLVSQPIDLSAFTVNSNINLSFFWQEGYGEFAPDSDDFLQLSFKTVQNEWVLVHSFGGSSLLEPTRFSQHFERINESQFLHEGFQFKFEILGNLSGDFDIWTIDYVYLNEGNIPVNTEDNAYDSYEDRTFTEKAGTPFGEYFALPLHHLDATWLEENLQTSDFIYNNLWAGNSSNFSFGTEFFSAVYDTLKPAFIIDSLDISGIFLTDLQDTARFTYQLENKSKFINHLITERDSEDSIYLNIQINLGTNDSLFFETINGTTQYYPDLTFRSNDTISTIIPLHDYYAYDDGTAESRVSLLSRNHLLAQGYEMIGEQYLTGVDIYVPNIGQNASTQNITLLVWDDLTNNTNDILRAQNVLLNQSEKINQFQRFSFERPVLLSGDFYIGYREENDIPVSIGFDKNTNSAENLFSITNNSWEPNTILKGSIMMRPVFEKKKVNLSNPEVIRSNWNIEAYPNPNRGILKLTEEWEEVIIYDSQGRLLSNFLNDGNQKHLDISNLKNDLYFLKIREGDRIATRKILLLK